MPNCAEARRLVIEPAYAGLSIVRQCELLGIARSSYYYQPCRDAGYNEQLMRWIDEEYTRHPFRGSRQMTQHLQQDKQQMVNRKRVRRLMRQMGIQGICPKRNLSRRTALVSQVFPYLLRALTVDRPNQVWAADITYIRMNPGWLYLVAILDWYSRYVVSWELSNSLDEGFCLEALEQALKTSRPEIFNTDQGPQFTGDAFIGKLQGSDIRVSWNGQGRMHDNIFVERLWRTVKYEDVYLHDYRTVRDVREGLTTYFGFYNQRRFHQSLDNRTPQAVYLGSTLTN